MIALIVLIGLVTTGGSSSKSLSGDWSNWKPTTTERIAGARQIAQHVGSRYKSRDGQQLLQVTGGPLRAQDVPLGVILRPQNGSIEELDGERGLLYTLNGLGPRGSISRGRPTNARGLLTRREALELALYSFRYLDDVDLVVTLLPPPPPGAAADGSRDAERNGDGQGAAPGQGAAAQQAPIQALFYRPGDLRPQLDVPLEYTLPPTPPRPESFAGPEADRVMALTRQNVFQASIQQAQNAQAYLVLERIPAE
jgi:hypothetical protein